MKFISLLSTAPAWLHVVTSTDDVCDTRPTMYTTARVADVTPTGDNTFQLAVQSCRSRDKCGAKTTFNTDRPDHFTRALNSEQVATEINQAVGGAASAVMGWDTSGDSTTAPVLHQTGFNVDNALVDEATGQLLMDGTLVGGPNQKLPTKGDFVNLWMDGNSGSGRGTNIFVS